MCHTTHSIPLIYWECSGRTKADVREQSKSETAREHKSDMERGPKCQSMHTYSYSILNYSIVSRARRCVVQLTLCYAINYNRGAALSIVIIASMRVCVCTRERECASYV